MSVLSEALSFMPTGPNRPYYGLHRLPPIIPLRRIPPVAPTQPLKYKGLTFIHNKHTGNPLPPRTPSKKMAEVINLLKQKRLASLSRKPAYWAIKKGIDLRSKSPKYLKIQKYLNIFNLFNAFLEKIKEHNDFSILNGFDPSWTEGSCLQLEKRLIAGLENCRDLHASTKMRSAVFKKKYARYSLFVYDTLHSIAKITTLLPRVELIPQNKKLKDMQKIFTDFDNLKYRLRIEYTAERRLKFVDQNQENKTHVNIVAWENLLTKSFQAMKKYKKLLKPTYVNELNLFEYETLYAEAVKLHSSLTINVKMFLSELEYIEIPFLLKKKTNGKLSVTCQSSSTSTT